MGTISRSLAWAPFVSIYASTFHVKGPKGIPKNHKLSPKPSLGPHDSRRAFQGFAQKHRGYPKVAQSPRKIHMESQGEPKAQHNEETASKTTTLHHCAFFAWHSWNTV